MQVPAGMTEEQVLEDIEVVVGLLARRFIFGHYDLEDIEQQIRMYAIEKLDCYDGVRPLRPFLYRVCKNQVINLVRNKFFRLEPPCSICFNGREHEHRDGRVCKRHTDWLRLNSRKANIARPLNIESVSDEHESCMRHESEVEFRSQVNEALEMIDRELPIEMRSTWLRIKAGLTVPRAQRQQVEQKVREIVKSYSSEKEE